MLLELEFARHGWHTLLEGSPMKRDLPRAEDDSDRKLLADIERVGWHIVGIDADEKGPGYAFSVGLFHSFEHAEIIMFGLPHETAARIINIIGIQVQGGTRFSANDQSRDVAEGLPVAFKMVPRDSYREYIGYALWFYRSLEFPVLQCVWPDKSGLFAWQDGYDHRFDRLQPILANPK
jgi:hypothetical protein